MFYWTNYFVHLSIKYLFSYGDITVSYKSSIIEKKLKLSTLYVRRFNNILDKNVLCVL